MQEEAHDLSHSQLQILFLLTMYSFSIFDYKEHNQSDFSIDHLMMYMCRVISHVFRKGGLSKVVCPVAFCTPRPTLPVTPGISWLPNFASQPTMMKRTFFLVLAWECVVGLHRTGQVQLLWHQWLRHTLGLSWCWVVALEMKQDHSVICEVAPKHCIWDSLGTSDSYFISSKEFLLTVVDIMVIWIKFFHSHHWFLKCQC